MELVRILLLLLLFTIPAGAVGRISSVQTSTGTVTFTGENGRKSSNVTVTSVNTSRAFVIVNGCKWTDDGSSNFFSTGCSAELTSATNVRVTANVQGADTTGGVNVDVLFTVIEAP